MGVLPSQVGGGGQTGTQLDRGTIFGKQRVNYDLLPADRFQTGK